MNVFFALGKIETKVDDQPCVEMFLLVISHVFTTRCNWKGQKPKLFIFPHSVYWHENLRTSDVYDAQDHNKKTALDYIASYLLTHFSVDASVAWAVLLLDGWLAAVALASCTRFVSFTTFFLASFSFTFVFSLLHLVRILLWLVRSVRIVVGSQLHFHSCFFRNLFCTRSTVVQAHSRTTKDSSLCIVRCSSCRDNTESLEMYEK